MSNGKAELRQEMLRQRGEVSDGVRAEWNEAILRHLFGSGRWRDAARVMVYCSFPDEVATRGILERALDEGKRLFLPRRVLGKKEFQAIEVLDLERDLEVTRFRGLVEPLQSLSTEEAEVDAIDLILVPGIAFDRRGMRLGFGAGMYDKFFSRHGMPYRVALAYGMQVVDVLPSDAHDVAMNAILTEEGWLEVGRQKINDEWRMMNDEYKR